MSEDEPTRSIEVSVEVPGTPDEVWVAIATGPGISSWFVPATVDEREGGSVGLDFGSAGTQPGVVTDWDPPRRFRYGGPDGEGLGFEWLVEARDGGTCVVRLVNSGFGHGDDWDAQYDGMSDGWTIFLANLRLHLTHHRGDAARTTVESATIPGPNPAAWSALCDAIGVGPDLRPGDPLVAGSGTPGLTATVDTVLDRPAAKAYVFTVAAPTAGTGFVTVEGDGDMTGGSVYLYFYGDDADAGDAWAGWLITRFPLP